MAENTEERQFLDCGDGDTDSICKTNNYNEAEKAYNNTKNYMS